MVFHDMIWCDRDEHENDMMLMMMIFGASGLHQVGQPLPTVEALSFFCNSRMWELSPNSRDLSLLQPWTTRKGRFWEMLSCYGLGLASKFCLLVSMLFQGLLQRHFSHPNFSSHPWGVWCGRLETGTFGKNTSLCMIWENNKEIGVNMMLEILWKCRTTIKKGSFSYNEQRKENKGINQQTAPTTSPNFTPQNSETLGECDPKLLHYPKNKGHAAPSGPAEFTPFATASVFVSATLAALCTCLIFGHLGNS